MKNRILIISILFLAIVQDSFSSVLKVYNEPDSVLLFSYASKKDEGRSGLKFAWSNEGVNWFEVAGGYSFVKCDYGRWGSEKRMVRPMLMFDNNADKWLCVWNLNQESEDFGAASSDDLLKWGRQSYFVNTEYDKNVSKSYVAGKKCEATIAGNKESGSAIKVPYSLIERLTMFAGNKMYRNELHNQTASQDAQRFADVNNLKADITIFPDSVKKISDKLIGIFFEDINYSADGGLYGELVQNRDFEYSSSDGSRLKEWNSTYAWSVEDGNSKGGMEFSIGTTNPIHSNNSHYAVIDVTSVGASLCNSGYDGISLKKGEEYIFSIFTNLLSGKSSKIKVQLVGDDGTVLASSNIVVKGGMWSNNEVKMKVSSSAKKGKLLITPLSEGSYALDMVSLFPVNTFKNRRNGLREDLAQTLADLKPRFVRFPGGCVAHGDGVDNIYDWKGSIGPLESRKPLRNLWGYHQTRGLGYHEYFLFCEDIGAEPLPVLAAGVPCQNSGTCSAHSSRHIDCGGQQGGIPMDKMDEYVQDVLDLIEYANGDAKSTYWGKIRAKAGHPKPFNMKYIGIGNEDLITDVFEERFMMIFNAVKKRYPEITVIGTVGPFYEGTDYEEGWKLATRENIPMVDEHYYNTPGWFINNQDFYDKYDRSKSKVYLGEYASHLPGRPSNIETALSDALYLTAIERNADVVSMTSYAPLLAKEGHTQWNPDMIYFNNDEVKPTVEYHVQKLFGNNSGDKYIASKVMLNNKRDDVGKRLGLSVVKDSKSGDWIVKIVNLMNKEVDADISLPFLKGKSANATLTLLTGKPDDKDSQPTSKQINLEEKFNYTIPSYSFTVLRISNKMMK